MTSGLDTRVHVSGRPVSASSYTNYGCRCVGCTSANAAALKRYRMMQRRDERDVSVHKPGRPVSSSTYVNRGCRCPGCTAAHSEARGRLGSSAAPRRVAPPRPSHRGVRAAASDTWPGRP